MVDQQIISSVKKFLCYDEIWDFSEEMTSIYRNELSKHNNNRGYGINPTSLEEVETNISNFFPRHFLKIQHSLFDMLSNHKVFIEEGKVTIIDIGCGPGTASLAVLDFCFQLVSAYYINNIEYPFKKPIKFNFILTDPSPHCLLKAQSLIIEYFQHIIKEYDFVDRYFDIQPRFVTFNREYPDVLPEIESVIDYTGKSNLVCLSNVLVQIKEKCKCSAGKRGSCDLCFCEGTPVCESNTKIIDSLKFLEKYINKEKQNSYVMIFQEKNNTHLIDPILPYESAKSYVATMKQKNHSSEYPNNYFTSQYGRAIYYWNPK